MRCALARRVRKSGVVVKEHEARAKVFLFSFCAEAFVCVALKKSIFSFFFCFFCDDDETILKKYFFLCVFSFVLKREQKKTKNMTWTYVVLSRDIFCLPREEEEEEEDKEDKEEALTR